jgi:hypothetical protein
VAFTESPYEFTISVTDGVNCTTTVPAQCTVPFLQPGESRTLQLYRNSVAGLVDPALPPGRTITLEVSSSVIDPNLSNNIASVMTTGTGTLQLPPQLVTGTSVAATFDLGADAISATDVTLTSSAASVLVTPATAHIAAGQRTAAFTLATTSGAARTLLTATIAGETKAALVAPIVANGQSPKLDVAIVAETKASYDHGELFVIPVRVAARYPNGTRLAGLVTLFDEGGNALSQLTLDTAGAATFTPSQPAPGAQQYRIGYSGDTRFNAVMVSLPTITFQKAQSTTIIEAPALSCSTTIPYRIVVQGPEEAAAPAGTVTLKNDDATFGTYTLSPNGIPGQSELTVSLTLVSGSRFMSATYSGDANYFGSTAWKSVIVGCAAMNLAATATTPTTVALSWTQPAVTATAYSVFRASSIAGPFEFISATPNRNAVDNTAQPDHVYVYYVIGYAQSGPPYYYSNTDIASTFTYTDHPLAAGPSIKSAHLTELRSMVAALRTAAGLPPLTFTGLVSRGNVVQAQHVTELRSSIDASRARLGLPAIAWTQPSAAKGGKTRAATLQEMRGAAN